MSLTDSSGSSFYSETNPNAISGQPPLRDTQGSLDNVIEMPAQATPPPYDMRVDQGGESFQPSPVTDPTFQPQLQPVSNPPSFNWPLIAAAGFVLYLIANSGRRR